MLILAVPHKTLIWERTRQVQRLRHQLREYFPAALEAFADLDACGCRKPAPPGQMLCRSRLARSRVRVPGGQVLVRPEMG